MLGWFTKIPIIGQVATIGAGIAIVAMLAFIFLLKIQVASLQSDVEKKNEQIGTLQVEKASLKVSITHQNEAVETWKNHGQALQNLLTTAMQTNQAVAAASIVRQQQIVQAKIPQDCPGAVQWLADNYNATVTRWNGRKR